MATKKTPAKKTAEKIAEVKAPAAKKLTEVKAPAAKKLTEAQKKAAEEIAKAKKAEAEAKKLGREAEKAKKAAEAEATKAKAMEKATSELERDAKEINHRLKQAEQLDGKADDHRLAAALTMAEAKVRCQDAGIKFNDWAEKNLLNADGKPLSLITIRKMLPIGAAEADKEGAGKLMLEDLRNKNAEANKKHREKKKNEAANASDTKNPERKKEPLERATEAIAAAKTKGEKANIVRAVAEKNGLEVMDAEEAKKLKAAARDAEESSKLSTRDRMEQLFGRMGQKGKVEFVKWAAKELGGEFQFDDSSITDTDPEESLDDDIKKLNEMKKRKTRKSK